MLLGAGKKIIHYCGDGRISSVICSLSCALSHAGTQTHVFTTLTLLVSHAADDGNLELLG